MKTKENLLERLRNGQPLSFGQQIKMIVTLSMPAILAQISSIVMQFIDASMVGQLGANDSASIGLVSSSMWLVHGVSMAAVTGFTVQVAQSIGANDEHKARNIMKQAYFAAIGFSLVIAAIAAGISGALPHWLGGAPEICTGATHYFLVMALSLPFLQLNYLSGGLLQATGNMKVPSALNILMCGLDVILNAVLIFPGREVFGIWIPGAGLGVLGAALGTALAQVVTALLMTYVVLKRSPMLYLRRGEKLAFQKPVLLRAMKIAIPIALEQGITSGAQVATTRIVSPLGTIAIAANSFAVTGESFCYMPGYGISSAATTIIGQSIGAKRKDLTKRLGWIATGLGMIIMGLAGMLAFAFAPQLISMLSPDPAIVELGASVLRIEALAEPLFAASIVAMGVFRGAGDTLVPSLFNLGSIWLIRVPLSAILAPRLGLHGVWIGMALELSVRGSLFLFRLAGKKWRKGLE